LAPFSREQPELVLDAAGGWLAAEYDARLMAQIEAGFLIVTRKPTVSPGNTRGARTRPG
jgi:hypothetical protein